MKRSMRWMVIAPNERPKTATATPPISNAGIIRLNEVAASITPAEKPSITSRALSDTFLVKRTGKAPAPVASPARKLASAPKTIKFIILHSSFDHIFLIFLKCSPVFHRIL